MFVQAVNTVSEMERLARRTVKDGDYLFVGGYHERGDGGGGTFVLDVGSGVKEDRGLVFEAHRSLGAHARWHRLDMGLGFISVKWFGAKGDGINNDLPAFEAAMRALVPAFQTEWKALCPDDEIPHNHISRGGAIVVPRSYPYYLLKGNLEINRTVHLYGELGNSRFPATVLKFADFEINEDCEKISIPITAGIIIKPPPVKKESSEEESEWERGTDTILRDLYIIGSEGNEANGIYMKSTATLERVRVRKFGGHGVFIDGRNNPEELRNCNVWRIHDCYFENNGKCGLHIDGGDTNAGLSTGLVVDGNKEWGIFDSTFIGSTHIAPTADANTLGAYKNGSAQAGTGIVSANDAMITRRRTAASSTWLNPYVEGSQPVELFESTVIVGGIGGFDPIVKDNWFYSLPAIGPILEVASISGTGRTRDIVLENWNSELCVEGKYLDVYDPTNNAPRNVARFTVESVDKPRINLSGSASDLALITFGDTFAPRGVPKSKAFRKVETISGTGGTRDIVLANWSSVLFVRGNRLDVYDDRTSDTPRNADPFTVVGIDRATKRITLSGTPSDLSLITAGKFVAPLGVPDAWWFGRLGRELSLRLGHRTLVTGFRATNVLGSDKMKVALAHAPDEISRIQATNPKHEWQSSAEDDNSIRDQYLGLTGVSREWTGPYKRGSGLIRYPRGIILGSVDGIGKLKVRSGTDRRILMADPNHLPFGTYSPGDVIFDSTGETLAALPTAPFALGKEWEAGVSINIGDVRIGPSDTAYVALATSGEDGISGLTNDSGGLPTPPPDIGDVVVDGEITWLCWGAATPQIRAVG